MLIRIAESQIPVVEPMMNTDELIVEEVAPKVAPKVAPAELIEMTVEQLGEVGGGVAYVLI